ncbi:MAG: putative toxin-antitoxin system toxin component, PIN family [Pseudomonadota bacterium]
MTTFGRNSAEPGGHRAVVDTSVLVSAFLFPGSLPGRLIKFARENRFEFYASTIIIDELTTALKRQRLRKAYGHSDQDVVTWSEKLRRIGTILPAPLPEIAPVCRDPDDDHVLAAAMAQMLVGLSPATRTYCLSANSMRFGSSPRGHS